MSELGDELHRLADQGAEQARPLPAAEIIRRGDQRRSASGGWWAARW